MTVTVVDAGLGNVPNVVRAFSRLGADVRVSQKPDEVARARVLVLPGVGAGSVAVKRLRGLGLDVAIHQAVGLGAWFLGICLGHQLLFQELTEFGSHQGLGLIPGVVTKLPGDVRCPHMGWARVSLCQPGFNSLGQRWFYFVHSFVAQPPREYLLATVNHESQELCAAVRRDRVVGVQFHPEKSGPAGVAFLREFLEMTA